MTETKVHYARAEVVLARDDLWPLREVPLTPDPLTGFAYAFADLRDDLGDHAEVAIDLVPVTRAAILLRRRKLTRKHSRAQTGQSSTSVTAEQIKVGLGIPQTTNGNSAGKQGGVARLDDLDQQRTLSRVLRSTEPHFGLQVLVRTQSEIKGRPQRLLQPFLATFEQYGAENYFKVRGWRVLGRYIGSDTVLTCWQFDRRFDRGVVPRSARKQLVAASIVGGLVKPPTARCPARNVIRTGGVVPPPPRTLPLFTGAAHQMPWGTVTHDEEQKLVAVDLAETYFTYIGGKSRYGKTETALVRFVHLARCGYACLFLDPHADALARVKPYLVGVADRVIELSIARGSGRGLQVGWNPFSMEGCTAEDLEDKTSAIVDSFAAAMGWQSDRTPRALTLIQQATLSLLQLSLQLPPDMAPTIFQMTTLLADEDWRNAVVPRLSPSLQSFWTTRFPRLGDEAITPVTNVIDRLRQSDSTAALLGSSRSTYNLRKAMDSGAIVLVRLRGTGPIDQLLASFVVYDLNRAVLSRWDTPPAKRPPMHAFMDEVQSYDHSIKGMLGQALEECAKFGLRLHLMNQQPTQLSPRTLNALLTNRSHLMTTQLGEESARLVSRELQGQVTKETIQDLAKYAFITQVTSRGQTTTPFRAGGLSLEAMYGPGCTDPDELRRFEERIDKNSGRRPITETLAELATLDDRIRDHLTGVVSIDDHRASRRSGGHRSDHIRRYGHSGGVSNQEDF